MKQSAGFFQADQIPDHRCAASGMTDISEHGVRNDGLSEHRENKSPRHSGAAERGTRNPQSAMAIGNGNPEPGTRNNHPQCSAISNAISRHYGEPTSAPTSSSIKDQNGLLRGRVSEPSDTVTAPFSPRNNHDPMLGMPSWPLPGLRP